MSEKYNISEGGQNVWGKFDDTRADEYANRSGDGDNHCHLWVNKGVDSGVEHRGTCEVCHDNNSSGGK